MQVLSNTDTSLISVIISKIEKERVHSQNVSMGFWKNPNGDHSCFDSETDSGQSPNLSSSQFIFIANGPWPDLKEKERFLLEYG